MIESFLMTIAVLGIVVVIMGLISGIIYIYGAKALYIMLGLILFITVWSSIHTGMQS